MDNGNCMFCPSKCSWNLHKNVPYICVIVYEEVTKTDEDLRNKYLKASDEKKTKEVMIGNLGRVYGQKQIEIQETLTSIRQTIQELQVYYLYMFCGTGSITDLNLNLTDLNNQRKPASCVTLKTKVYSVHYLAWYAEFLLKVLRFLIGKIAARLIFKIMLKSLHIDPEY